MTRWPTREQWTATWCAQDPADDVAWRYELERRAIFEETVIEPFLGLIREGKVVPAPELPLSNMITALFDYVGIAPSERPIAIEVDDNREVRQPLPSYLKWTRLS